MLTTLLNSCRQGYRWFTRSLRQNLAITNSREHYILIETLSKAYYLKKGNPTRHCIVEPALDCTLQSKGWTMLENKLGSEVFEKVTIVLHPHLYITQTQIVNATKERLQPLHNSFVSRVTLPNNNTIVYSCSEALNKRYPWCKAIIPYAELIRAYANREPHLGWVCANERFVWIMDIHYYFHEVDISSNSLSTLITTLIDNNLIANDCRCIVSKNSQAKQLLASFGFQAEEHELLDSMKSVVKLLFSRQNKEK